MNKHVFFRHYPKIAMMGAGIAVAVALVALVLGASWPAGWQVTIGTFGIVAGFVYFMQQQRLADVRMLHELFTKFNERYDKMNDDLNQIVETGDGTVLTNERRRVLHNYCNLCAEEYFFATHGYIYPEIWTAWLTGMRWFYSSSRRIRDFWDEELKKNPSYYGMSIQLLQQPAKPT